MGRVCSWRRRWRREGRCSSLPQVHSLDDVGLTWPSWQLGNTREGGKTGKLGKAQTEKDKIGGVDMRQHGWTVGWGQETVPL